MLADTVKRRLGLARWYAQESIVHEAGGDVELATEDISTAAEYLEAVLGRKVAADTASDIIAVCCAVEDGSLQPAPEYA